MGNVDFSMNSWDFNIMQTLQHPSPEKFKVIACACGISATQLKKSLYQEKVRSLVIFCTDLNNYLPHS